MSRVAELRERRRTLYEEAHGTLTESEKENRDLAGEDLAKWEAQMAEVDRLGKEIEAREKDEQVRARLEGTPQPEPKIEARGTQAPPGVTPYEVAFRSWLRGGRDNLDATQRRSLAQGAVSVGAEQRALGVGTGAAGGFTVPQDFLRELIVRMKAFGAVRRVARVISTDSGADMPFPSMDDTANVGRILAENTALTQTDVAFTTKTLKAYMYSSDLVLVSYQLMQDSAFPVETELRDALGERLGRIMNQHFTTGTGTAQPQGIVTGATVGVTGATGTATTYGTAPVAYGNLISLIHSVDPAYRQSGRAQFMMSDASLAQFRTLADTTGRPLWQPSLQAGTPDNLLGYPVEINPDMPVPAAGAKSALFGDFAAGYIVRDVRSVQIVRLDERYADNLQVGFFGFARADGIVRDAHAYRAFVHSAT